MADVTLEHLSKAAGVAKSTVSMALRNHPHIAVKTRERIQRLAEEMGYRPNPSISALMAHIRNRKPIRSHDVLAFVSGFPDVAGLEAVPEYREAYRGARARAEEQGYRMDFFELPEKKSGHRRLSDILTARGIQVVVIGPHAVKLDVAELAWDRFSSAMIGYGTSKPPLNRAVPNHYTDVLLAIKRLLQAGYRRIGACFCRRDDADADYLLSAAYQAYQARLAEADRVPLLLMEDPQGEGFLAWMAEHRPEAVIVQDERPYGWLREAGYTIPADVACLPLTLEPGEPFFSGICPHWRLVGAAAVDLAVAAARRNETGIPPQNKNVQVYGYWIDGRTHTRREARSPIRECGFEGLMYTGAPPAAAS
ncbi:MAG: LacI family DNA-binding transcriptional regulator [Opitutales bacterium]